MNDSPQLTPWYTDIPMAILAVIVCGVFVAASVAAAINAPKSVLHWRASRPQMLQSTSRFAWGCAAMVGLVGLGAFTGQVWIILLAFALTIGYTVVGFLDTTSRIVVGDECVSAGVMPHWVPWTCPVHNRDCRQDPEGRCEYAQELLHPTPEKRGEWSYEDRERFERLAGGRPPQPREEIR